MSFVQTIPNPLTDNGSRAAYGDLHCAWLDGSCSVCWALLLGSSNLPLLVSLRLYQFGYLVINFA